VPVVAPPLPVTIHCLGQALVESGWMMLAVLGVNHAFSPAQTGELGLTTVPTLKMWQFIVLVLVSRDKALTAVQTVSLGHNHNPT